MSGWLPLPLADAVTSTHLRFARLQDMSQRWHWMLLLTLCIAVLAYVIYTYYRDSVELPLGVTLSLLVLRVFAFAAILFSFLDLEKKTERRLVKPSRVVLLVDTSQSMGLKDVEPDSGGGVTGPRRIDQIMTEFTSGQLIGDLRQKHNVTVMQFDQGSKPQQVATFTRVAPRPEVADTAEEDQADRAAAFRLMRVLVLGACAAAVVGLGLGLLYFIFAGSRYTGIMSWALFGGVLLALSGLVAAAIGHLSNSDIPLAAVFGSGSAAGDAGSDEPGTDSNETDPGASDDDTTSPGDDDEKPVELEPSDIDWETVLVPQGLESRLGDNLADVVQRERGGPLAGIAVFTDGRSNAGIDCEEAVTLARDANIPLYPIGMGSVEQPANVRLVDIEAPPRVFPGDKFPITAYIQGYGLEGRRIKVELASAPAETTAEGEPSFDFEEEVYVRLGTGDAVLPIKFEITPGHEEGRRYYRVSTEPLAEEADLQDNQTRTTIEIVERKNRVLLLADGPTREFRFLRNLLYRDDDVTIDVFLQSATSGISQDADEILFDFPVTEEELFDTYDCIVAFDPNWSKFEIDQVQLLDRWVAEKAGGLILIAGPVNTPSWTRRQRGDALIDTIKGLHPVIFDRYGSASRNRMDNDMTQSIAFTREGEMAEFLWLDDSAIGSEGNWALFDGVYGYGSLSIKEIKAGATLYARLAESRTDVSDEASPYFVAQFYGAGRVFFMGSGEMWRIRSLSEEYFDTFYTKLIRHVSQGRLLRDSSRGVLMVSKPRCLLGDTIVVRAHLSDRQFAPLDVSEVEAQLVLPGDQRTPITLKPVKDAPRRGLYAGQFTALVEGDYRVELMIPDSDDAEMLSRDVRARMPDLEIERPQRNDVLLKVMAKKTGGDYYVGVPATVGRLGAPSLSSVIEPNNVPTTLPDTPDTDFDRRLMAWLLAAICGALSLEWLIRRLSKLA